MGAPILAISENASMNQDINLLMFFIGVFVFVAFFYSYWQTVCIDWARQLMFEERGNLVQLVLKGQIEFDSVEYRTIRRHIEINIRFLHALTWPRLLLWDAMRHHYLAPYSRTLADRFWKIIESNPNPETRKALWGIRLRIGFAAIVCLMGRSIIFGPIFLCLYCLRLLRDTSDARPAYTLYAAVSRSAEYYDEAQTGHVTMLKHAA